MREKKRKIFAKYSKEKKNFQRESDFNVKAGEKMRKFSSCAGKFTLAKKRENRLRREKFSSPLFDPKKYFI
jgi:hypothetical protein